MRNRPFVGQARTVTGDTAQRGADVADRVHRPGVSGRVDGEVVPGPDGRWIAHLTIPEQGASAFPATPGRYPITALCYATEGAEAGYVSYRARHFSSRHAAAAADLLAREAAALCQSDQGS
jgi:hypothetical protein